MKGKKEVIAHAQNIKANVLNDENFEQKSLVFSNSVRTTQHMREVLSLAFARQKKDIWQRTIYIDSASKEGRPLHERNLDRVCRTEELKSHIHLIWERLLLNTKSIDGNGTYGSEYDIDGKQWQVSGSNQWLDKHITYALVLSPDVE